MILVPASAEAAFRAELANTRQRAGLTVDALAMEIGIAPSEIARGEAGQRAIDVMELFLWCRACGSSLDDFAERMQQREALPLARETLALH